MSEAVDGAGAGHNVVFAVILGSGAGAGVAVAGKAHHGPNNSAGEWGHNPFPDQISPRSPDRPVIAAGMDASERWVSGWSFARDYHRHASIDLAPADPFGPAEIVTRMRDGDRLAKLVRHRYIDRVARGLSVVVNTLDPDIVVLGGGMANVDELYDDLPPRLAQETFSPCFYTPVVRAMHGDSSGVRGAAWLWRW